MQKIALRSLEWKYFDGVVLVSSLQRTLCSQVETKFSTPTLSPPLCPPNTDLVGSPPNGFATKVMHLLSNTWLLLKLWYLQNHAL